MTAKTPGAAARNHVAAQPALVNETSKKRQSMLWDAGLNTSLGLINAKQMRGGALTFP